MVCSTLNTHWFIHWVDLHLSPWGAKTMDWVRYTKNPTNQPPPNHKKTEQGRIGRGLWFSLCFSCDLSQSSASSRAGLTVHFQLCDAEHGGLGEATWEHSGTHTQLSWKAAAFEEKVERHRGAVPAPHLPPLHRDSGQSPHLAFQVNAATHSTDYWKMDVYIPVRCSWAGCWGSSQDKKCLLNEPWAAPTFF